MGLRPQNFFDVSGACKMADYEQFGQSIYNSPLDTLPTLFERHGLTADRSRKLEHLRYLHIYLKKHLSPPILRIMAEKAQVDLDVLSQTDLAEARGKRKALKQSIDWRCVHVRVERGGGGSKRHLDLEATLREYLEESGVSHERITSVGGGGTALVELAYHPHVAKVVADLPSRRFADGLVLSARSVEKTVMEGILPKRELPAAALRQELESSTAALERRGFFKAVSGKTFTKVGDMVDTGTQGGLPPDHRRKVPGRPRCD